jgi:AcrR family transcriptional regulator
MPEEKGTRGLRCGNFKYYLSFLRFLMPARPAHPTPAPLPAPPAGRILEAARVHLFMYGYSAFTMDDLAAELGMSK